MPRLQRLVHGSMLAASLLAPLAMTPLRAQGSPPEPERLAAAVDSFVRREVLPRGVPGISIAVTRGGETLLERGWGYADIEAKRPAEASTIYYIASASKQFTAALLLKQVDRGRLAPTDTIGHHLAGLRPEWTGRTVAQLLNHTAGLPRDFRQVSRRAEAMSVDTMIALAAHSPAPTAPADGAFAYSNVGYMLLGALVEKLYGRSYREALRDEVARPLGLRTLDACLTTDRPAALASGYQRSPSGGVAPAPFNHPSQMLGAGGICASAADMTAWNRALHTGRVLSADSYAAMTTPRGAARRSEYGFGLYVHPLPGGAKLFVHHGTTGGYAAENLYDGAASLSVTVLTNAAPSLARDVDVALTIARLALGYDAPPPRPPRPR